MAWRWPWSRETRATQPFTDAITSAIVAQAAGTTAGDPSAIAALEACAGIWSRAFAAATVEPAHPAVTPAVLALIARDLIRRGESVFAIEVEGAAPVLRPAGSWDVRGPWREAEWFYRVDLFGPSGNVTRFVPSATVVHARYSTDPSRPWLGLGPLDWARHTGALAANLELRLSEEASGAVSRLIPIPADGGAGSDDDPLAGLKADIAAGKGRALMVETVSAGWGEGRAAAPQADWRQQRIGADPPAPLISLRDDASMAVMHACGVPATLIMANSDGTAQRESWRRFVMGSVRAGRAHGGDGVGPQARHAGPALRLRELVGSRPERPGVELQSDGHGRNAARQGRRAGRADNGRSRMTRVVITGDHAELIARKLGEVASQRVRRRAVNEAGKSARAELPELLAAVYHTTKTGSRRQGPGSGARRRRSGLSADPQSANQDRAPEGRRPPVRSEAWPAHRPAEAQASLQADTLSRGERLGQGRIRAPRKPLSRSQGAAPGRRADIAIAGPGHQAAPGANRRRPWPPRSCPRWRPHSARHDDRPSCS